jgi:hypothetical protein
MANFGVTPTKNVHSAYAGWSLCREVSEGGDAVLPAYAGAGSTVTQPPISPCCWLRSHARRRVQLDPGREGRGNVTAHDVQDQGGTRRAAKVE